MIDYIRKILFVLTQREKKKLGLLLTLDTLVSTADIVFLAGLLVVINFYAQGDSMLHRNIIPYWLANRHSPALIAFFLLFFLLKSGGGYLTLRARYRFVYQVASRLAAFNLSNYLDGDYENHVDLDSAIHSRRISQEPIEFCQYILAGGMQAFTEIVLIVLAIAGIIWYDARLFLLLLIILLPALFILSYITRRKLRQVRTQVKASSVGALQYLREALSGYVESNVYGKNTWFANRYSASQQDLNRYLAELQITQGIPSRLIEVFAILGLLILITVHASAFAVLGAFMAAAYKIIPGIVKLSNISGQMKTYAFVLPDLLKGEEINPKKPTAGPEDIVSISFDQVSFSYKQREVLNNCSFQIRQGDFFGISGASGSGKTTIIHLLLGFLSPGKGDILVNGKRTNGPSLRRYWKKIAYVKQQPFLLHDTLLRNITLGSDYYEDKRMQDALEGAGWTGSYPDCLAKIIGEQGRNISGGQRQRIAIARALYKNADLILLDEPFNELDSDSELCLLQVFQRLSQSGKIIVLITHHTERFSFCNKVIKLHEQG
jgi:ABC-type multidrug transport system fused ATPase/permease subunit